MKSISHCSQYYPYAGKITPCGGKVHELSIQWEKAGGLSNPTEPQSDTQVCEAHMSSFEQLGQRDEYRYKIVRDEIVGTIISPSIEGQLPTKERE